MTTKPVGKHLKAYLERIMAVHGVTLIAAAASPGAREAEALDNAEHAVMISQRTTEEFLGARKGEGFKSREDREAAYGARDKEGRKLYEVNPAYRDAVVEMAKHSTEEVMGLQRPFRNVPDDASMLKQARYEAYQEGRAELFEKANAGGPGAARARLALMEYDQSADPQVRQMLEENERSYAESHPMEMALKEAKANGVRVGTSLNPTDEQIQNIEEHPYDPYSGETKPAPGEE